jgi:hypothetical protein
VRSVHPALSGLHSYKASTKSYSPLKRAPAAVVTPELVLRPTHRVLRRIGMHDLLGPTVTMLGQVPIVVVADVEVPRHATNLTVHCPPPLSKPVNVICTST